MKSRPDALITTETVPGSAKYENGTRHPPYRQKRVREHKIWKRDSTPSVSPKTCPRVQNIKTGPDALRTTKNMSGSIKHDNGIGRPRYHRKWVRTRKTWKRDPTHSAPSKTSSGAQNMKSRPDALDTAENESGTRKTWKRDPAPTVPPENESGNARHENRSRRPRFRWKRVRERKTWKRHTTPSVPPKMSQGAQNMKSRPDALRTPENVPGSAKHENGTRCPRYLRKWVRERQTCKREPTPSVLPKTS
jgi:hypothetical protein